MPNTKSAEKRLRTDARRRLTNQIKKSMMRTYVRRLNEAVEDDGEPFALRRARRGDQRHAADPAGQRRRGHPPRAQPLGAGDRGLCASRRMPRHRDHELPGRARRVPPYMRDLLAGGGREHIRIFAGGGGVILPDEIEELHAYGVDAALLARRRPRDGPAGHDRRPARACDFAESAIGPARSTSMRWVRTTSRDRPAHLGRRELPRPWPLRWPSPRKARRPTAPVLGITGTGGAGKSSLVDELVRRFLIDFTGQAHWPSSPSTRRSGRPAARCSATASA
jgi:hypothetical protein